MSKKKFYLIILLIIVNGSLVCEMLSKDYSSPTYYVLLSLFVGYMTWISIRTNDK